MFFIFYVFFMRRGIIDTRVMGGEYVNTGNHRENMSVDKRGYIPYSIGEISDADNKQFLRNNYRYVPA